ncbi:unnamed protein product [Dovyalis caffra]|uniref:Uncharacterized protein n=1 Tax=Dovyalis caffra TaxID=77055 RepID=A0AAV1S2Y7_9ROSI|nr:unnamed protein product [Dovyalis caffra]
MLIHFSSPHGLQETTDFVSHPDPPFFSSSFGGLLLVAEEAKVKQEDRWQLLSLSPIFPTVDETSQSCDDIEILANGDESEEGDILPDLEVLELSLFAEIESNTGRATVNKKLLKSQLFEIGRIYCDRLEDIFEENEIEPEMIRSDGHQLPRFIHCGNVFLWICSKDYLLIDECCISESWSLYRAKISSEPGK